MLVGLRFPFYSFAVAVGADAVECGVVSTSKTLGLRRGSSVHRPRLGVHTLIRLSGYMSVYCPISCAGDQAASQQLGGLSIQNNDAGTAGTAATAGRLTACAAQPSSIPDSAAVPVGGASAAATAAVSTALPGSSAAQADARAAFQRRVHVHFSRLMAGGGVTPAAAAAQALKLAAQG
jgi:hypothetical protein